MNYLAHGWRFTHDPYFLAGTAVPDWLCVADRGVRVRSKRAAEWTDGCDAETAAVARGICRHHADDRWFHQTRAFAELSLGFSRRTHDALPADEGFRPWFLGHILVELLLDAALIEQRPERLTAYYAALAEVDGAVVEAAVNRIALQPAQRLSNFISLFCRARFLYDYTDDGKLLVRLNQVMQRVRLPALPASFVELLPAMRDEVRNRQIELLDAEQVAAGVKDLNRGVAETQ
ncbi:MAG: hypothetical protein WD894_18430 [Pirellulales bacterium]